MTPQPALKDHPTKPATAQNAEPWFVLGAGSMGCLWSVAMTQHLESVLAQPVTLLLRDDNAVNFYPGKVTVEHSSGTTDRSVELTLPAMSVNDTSHGAFKIKRLLVACKAQDADAALASVAAMLDEQAIIVLLQNGLKFQQQLSLARPPGTVFCLSTSFGAWQREPFHVVAAGGGESWLGHLREESSPILQRSQLQLLSELPDVAMNIRIDDDMQRRLWEKLAVNCAINGLTVIYNCRNGELLTRPAAREHCQRLCTEISTLMQGIALAPDMPELWQRVQQVAQATALNVSSTLQDVRRGKHTEIEHLNGYLIELADRHRLPCPLNQQVVAAVLESGRPL
ncbi:MAG: 2-dehydropantoate 2-reductase [Pseudohongiella sp.]|nr:2-dehydropantoate 2-reductase [Pseudohongiella sp.]